MACQSCQETSTGTEVCTTCFILKVALLAGLLMIIAFLYMIFIK